MRIINFTKKLAKEIEPYVSYDELKQTLAFAHRYERPDSWKRASRINRSLDRATVFNILYKALESSVAEGAERGDVSVRKLAFEIIYEFGGNMIPNREVRDICISYLLEKEKAGKRVAHSELMDI